MFSLDPSQASGKNRRPGWVGAAGPVLLAVVFLLALVLAANNNTVLGWIIAAIALGWLILATLVYVGVARAARFGADQMRRVQQDLAQQNMTQRERDSTRLVDEQPRDGVRDMKLDHSFKIVQVQARVIAEQLDAADQPGLDAAAKDMVDRALETIQITSHNARDMLGSQQEERRSGGNGADGEPISGVVVPD
ncbi:hypothetical protein ODZ83_01970 [Acaricomes phytoseiuli]|uniref:hypothetical protein n=1 Tax=Acaricomes phytoseiuli TaxID=291968 RepID=UPI00036E69C2|nr:hypothetical protein [Acaricomes phytoseiuli]MCW1248971.1 hypothetical protein [Acaricomes phytoseiuli]